MPVLVCPRFNKLSLLPYVNPLIPNAFHNSLSHSILILIVKLKPLLLKVVDSWRIEDNPPFCFERVLAVFIIANDVHVMRLHTLINMP